MDHSGGFWQWAIEPELERKADHQLLSQSMMKKKPIYPIPDHTGGSDLGTSHAFPTGKRLRQIEHELSTTHAPKKRFWSGALLGL